MKRMIACFSKFNDLSHLQISNCTYITFIVAHQAAGSDTPYLPEPFFALSYSWDMYNAVPAAV
jgi:hypothetical protein